MTNEKKPRPRVLISLDPPTQDLLQEIADTTGLRPALIVNQLVRAHVQELREFNDWIKRQEGDARILGVHALGSYGSKDLLTEMQRIDPSYQGPEMQRLATGGISAGKELAELRDVLMERRARKHAR
jgi:hypothetical protein